MNSYLELDLKKKKNSFQAIYILNFNASNIVCCQNNVIVTYDNKKLWLSFFGQTFLSVTVSKKKNFNESS
jgi:hypothetical protein